MTEEWRGAATTNTAASTNCANYAYDPIGQLTSDLAAELIGSTNRMNEQLRYTYDLPHEIKPRLNRCFCNLLEAAWREAAFVCPGISRGKAGNLAYRTNNALVEKFQVSSVNELTTGTNGGRLTVMGTTSSQATNVTVHPVRYHGYVLLCLRFAQSRGRLPLYRILRRSDTKGKAASGRLGEFDLPAGPTGTDILRGVPEPGRRRPAREVSQIRLGQTLFEGPPAALSHGVNGTNALLYGDATFAATNMPLTTAYTAIARDAYGRINTNTATVSLATNSPFQYDLNGNLTNDGTMSFAYDDENQLTQVWVRNQWASVFTYDGKMRRRIRQEYTWSGGWVQTNIVYYVYDENVVIQERDLNYLPTVTYTRGKDLSGSLEGAGGIGGLLARTDMSTSQAAFYHADGNGNVTMLVNASQAVVAKYLYDAFGNTLSLSGPLVYANLYRFSSKEVHHNSGLVYYVFRYYDPNLQRWLNQDPIGEAGGINLYRFVGNNPLNWVDPMGLWGIDPDSNPGGINVVQVVSIKLPLAAVANQSSIPYTTVSSSTGPSYPISLGGPAPLAVQQDILNAFSVGQFAGTQVGQQMYQDILSKYSRRTVAAAIFASCSLSCRSE